MIKTKIENFIGPKKTLTYISYIVFCIFFLLFVVKCVSIVKTTTFSFDGAMNALAVHSLYGSEDNLYRGYDFFDPRIQTGVPVSGLVALSFLFFGESFEAGLLVNLIYALLFSLVMVYYLKNCLGLDFFFVNLAFLLFISTRQLFYHAFGLYGELPALAFLLLSIVLFHKFLNTRNNHLLTISGIFLSLSVLTKTVMLISIPAYLVTTIILFIVESWKSKDVINFYWRSFLGFFTPLFIFELTKLLSMGIDTYIQWWQNMSDDIVAQAGITSRFEDTHGIINKLLNHLNNLSINVDLPMWVILFTLALLFLSLTFFVINIYLDKYESRLQKLKTHSMPLDVITIFIITLSYFGWWLIITPTQKAMFRRIINGVYLLNICLPILIFYFRDLFSRSTNRTIQNKNNFFSIISIFLSICLMIFGVNRFIKFKNYEITFTDSELKTTYLSAGEIIHNLPENSTIYGTGWWQAPILSFASQRDFYDIDLVVDSLNSSDLINSYLVSDHYESIIDPTAPDKILSLFDYELQFSENNVNIYKLNLKLSEPN